ncbi:hypothetical protein [Jatrophihabitans endophyticus]|nr:hypothetical protein [Jatrophihabitans endophyticus]
MSVVRLPLGLTHVVDVSVSSDFTKTRLPVSAAFAAASSTSD